MEEKVIACSLVLNLRRKMPRPLGLVIYCRTGITKRNPSLVRRDAGSDDLLRVAVRMFFNLLSQEPPRSAFSSPLDGPAGLSFGLSL